MTLSPTGPADRTGVARLKDLCGCVANLHRVNPCLIFFVKSVDTTPHALSSFDTRVFKHFLDSPVLLVYDLFKSCTKDVVINGSYGG